MTSQPSRGQDTRDRVGPYVLVKAIGSGGSARVDLARIERAYGFQRHVVIKRPLEHLRADGKAGESLRREARLGARLRHPNLVAILDAGVHDGYDYLVLDYVHGGSLRELMQTDEGARVRDVSLEVALAIVRDVARGVHEAHELKDEHGAPLGLVHRDVSPGNVLIGLDGAVKLADFGIAKETRVATLSGSMHGTVTYMAPEQCRGHAFDRRADVFSLGVILYELVTGTRLFWADNDVASLHRVLAGTIPRPRKVRPGIAPELEEIIMTAVAHDQDRRFASTRTLADAIETFAMSNGQILVSRWVARWTHDLIGPRDAPWIGDNTVIDMAPAPPAQPVEDYLPPVSLVALIAQTPVEEQLPLTFGPTDAALFEDGPHGREHERPVAVPRRRKNGVVIAALAATLVIGGLVALVAAREDGNPTTEPAATEPTATERAGAEPAATKPAATDRTPDDTAAPPAVTDRGADDTEGPNAEAGSGAPDPAAVDPDPAEVVIDPDPEELPAVADEPTKQPTRRKRRRVTKREPAKAKTVAPAGTGSAGKASPKVEWDKTMLMPTDPAKQKKR